MANVLNWVYYIFMRCYSYHDSIESFLYEISVTFVYATRLSRLEVVD